MLRRLSNVFMAVIGILCGLADCDTTSLVEPYAGSAQRDEVVYVISGGWHTELGLPLSEIGGPLATLKLEFPIARYLVFGWGARDYYMARDPGIGDLLRAAAPGPAVMLLIPLQIAPEAFFGASNAFDIPVSRDGIQRLSRFLSGYLAMDKNGAPQRIGNGPYPGSLFYASTGTYDLGHTCNTWTAEALRLAGLPVSTAGVVFARQVLDQLPPILEAAPKRDQSSAGISLRAREHSLESFCSSLACIPA
jgi:uncharacterized protein (TIGR02117 family)